MSDKQNLRLDKDESPRARDEASAEKTESTRSYYYDDATGYEIYEDEDDIETGEEVDNAEDAPE